MEIDNEIESRLEKPLVSIVIPAYNAADTICRAVDSALNQEYEKIEVIVVDDKSTDNTVELLREYGDRIKLICHDVNKNGAAARNSGVQFASGKLISLLDSDDEYHSDKVSAQVHAMIKLGLCANDFFCIACLKDEKDEAAGELVSISMRSIFLKEHTFNSSTLLISRAFYDDLGGFDVRFKRHQDLEFLVRASVKGNIFLLKKCLIDRHFSGSPKFSATRSGIEYFWEKFHREIASLSKSERSIVYAFGYRRMAELAFNEGKYVVFILYCFKTVCEKPSFLFNKLGYYLRRGGRLL